MSVKQHILRASWTLIDQGVVSLGNFLVNVFLARVLMPAEYGTFALLMGGLYTLQIVNISLVFYPMSVRLALARGDDRRSLLGTAIVLVAFSLLPLCIVLALTLLAFNLGDIVPSALACFILWQLQEATRRGLLASLSLKAAVVGDTVSYLGQFSIAVALAAVGALSLTNILYGMAATSGLALLIQAYQLRLSLRGPHQLRRTAQDFWSIGRWSLANNLASNLRLQLFPWALALGLGAAGAASFQAVLNVLNLANPVIIGLTNIIPQTAALAQTGGIGQAWRSARTYVYFGLPPIFAYYAFALVAPEFLLYLFYGPGSPYLELSFALRLLIIAFIPSYLTEMICSFLHGVDAPRLALVINALGAATAVLLVFPLSIMLGLAGSCVALAAANMVRLSAAQYILARKTTGNPRRFT
jgi:O-antigen/teichoic acid export membrane protein